MSNMDTGSTDSYFLEILENTAEFDHDLFSIFENLENDPVELIPPLTPLDDQILKPLPTLVSEKSVNSSTQHDSEAEIEVASSNDTFRSNKRAKISVMPSLDEEAPKDGQQRIMHIKVERNRRKQMNEHLSVLRTLMPCFYVKRGDQASIIGGVVDYIKELQQVLQSLEAQKQRKVYNEVLSPRIVSSPRPSTALSSPRKPPPSPRVNLPISPRTPQPSSPYKHKPQQQLGASYNLSPSIPTTNNTSTPLESAASSSSSSFDHTNVNKELVTNSKSSVAEVEVKFSGPNVLLKTVSPRLTGQVLKIITAIEDLSLEILHLSINIVDETMVNSFTIKIGIECQLSVEDLAHEIQQTFS